ncbi:MAG: flavin reductase family protein [Rheinheimera sp.]|nr:MAG: flavin reductase family protein [Rheinheimera sp.]
MIFDCNTLTAAELYPLLAGTIVPRPIAWVSTLNENGQSNLAPFSFFQLVCDAPPTLMLSVNRKAGGAQKDTARNIAATCQLVVHLVSPGDLALMNASAGDYAPDVSEIEALQIATVPALKVRPPRLAHSLVSFECECVSLSAYPAEAPACDLILAKVLCLHIDDSLLNSEGRIRHDQIDWLARLGGQWYCHSQHDDNLTLARPNQATPRR